MTRYGKKLYGQVVRFNHVLKPVAGIGKAIIVLMLGGLAGKEYCQGEKFFSALLLGAGIIISLGGLRRDGVAKL